ncbi:hypothetical protein [Ectobacillus panaciterrae]|uniref:hypothetical protein n=1 Tax=Ectobacillus panaciterrae TaxID=363872 RepID=UPI000409982A|nr:hypothetical protein [Ectobacillus panaciterrae]
MSSTKNISETYSSKISSKIWGHRFISGQRGPEYALEFLNVLYGASYNLNASKYKRTKAVELRKFIFEGAKEGASRDTVTIDATKKQKLYETLRDKDNVSVIREFLRNLEVPIVNHSGKLADRSWYAKTLYPLHESLLFFEVRVKGKSVGIERNFFARGGELYYLMISFGTKNFPERKEFIESRFKELLSKHNSIKRIVSTITDVLEDTEKEEYGYIQKQDEGGREELPHLPVNDHILYEEFAIELEQLLKLDIDVYEMFKLLTSLMCFQLLRYMYTMAKIDDNQEILMFFDCLDGQINQVLRLSSRTFQDNDVLIKEKFEDFFKNEFQEKIPNEDFLNEHLSLWKSESAVFFKHMGLSHLHATTKAAIKRTLAKCSSFEDVNTNLFESVKDVVSDQLKKHQLNIIKVLVRDGGIGNYKAGSKYRYTLSDSLLQILVYTNVLPNESMEFSEFLNVLYKRYGIVVGERQAKMSKIYENSKLNIAYFHKNELALREKLKSNGLLIEYSDATAMIRNPYEVREGVFV